MNLQFSEFLLFDAAFESFGGVEGDDFAIRTDELLGYLQPSARRRAEINHLVSCIQEAKALL